MQLIAATFSNKHRATEILADLGDLDVDWGVPLDHGAVAISRSKHGKIRIHQSHEAAGTGAFLGGLAGFVVGALVFSPVLGTALGAVTGGAIGSTNDPFPLDGIDKDFLKQLGTNLPNNSSGLLMLIPDAAASRAAAALKAYDDGVMFDTAIDAPTEQAIRKAFDNRQAS